MEVRRLTWDDLDAFRAIRRDFLTDDEDDWADTAFFGPATVAVGAFDRVGLVGYAAAGLRSHAEGAWDRPPSVQRIAYLEEWFVRPSHRRRGVGRKLVEEVERWAREIRADYLGSDTEIDNELSQAAHTSLGFEEVERAVHFLKHLPPAMPVEGRASESEVTLRELDQDTGVEIMRLRVTPSQESFVAPNTVSLAEASLTTDVVVRGIFAGDVPVGFAMISTRERQYYLWRFMIDHRYQGRGYGRRAMELVIDLVRSLPGATELTLSYVKSPGGPGPFYAALGFTETGEIHDGEHVMVMAL
jgi:diamine N-acetyltransferase